MNEDYSQQTLDKLLHELENYTADLNTSILDHLLAMSDDLSANGDWPRAWRALHIAECNAQAQNEEHYLAECLIHRGILYHRQGKLRLAAKAWEQASDQFEAIGQTEGIANCETNLGVVYKSIGYLRRAQDCLEHGGILSSRWIFSR